MVKVTMEVLSAATFGADPFHAQELNLSDRDIHDLGVVTQLTQLTELNLAFNRLDSLQSLSELRGLRALNVSHNNLASLKGLVELTGLEQLNASCNQIKHLGPLARCSSLHTLWLQKNQVHDTMQLAELGAALPDLTHLWLGGNPLCKLGSRAAYRASVLGAFENLRALDSRSITEEDHEAAAGGEEPLMMPGSNHDRPDGDYAQDTAQGGGPGSAAPPKFGRRSRSGSRKHPNPQKSDIPDDFSISQVAGLLPDLGVAPKDPPKPSPGQRKSQKAKPVGSPAKQGRRSRPPSSGPAPWDEEEDPNLAAAKQMLKALGQQQQQQPENGRRSKPQSSNGQGIGGAGGEEEDDEDPTLAMARRMLLALGEQQQQQQQQPDKEEKAAGAAAQRSSSSSNGSGNSGTYEATYAKGGGSAVVVHGDGSVRVSWPNGEVALMCQTEQYAQRQSYRLQVHYRVSGALAAAFDPDGSGFVQYPDGRMMLMYRADGEGTVYAPDGTITRQWHDSGRGGLEPLAAGGPVQAQLDQFLGVRLASGGDGPAGEGKPQLEVFFACEGVKQRVVHGRNPTRKSWGADGGPQPPFLDSLGRGPQRRKKEPPPPRDTRPVDARMEDVTGVANAMNDLGKELSSWLTGLKPT